MFNFYPNPGPMARAQPLDTAAVVELVGAFLFALLAGVATSSGAVAAAYAATMFFAAFASGAHINPSMSVASALSGHLPWTRVLVYFVAQVLGTLGGTACLLALVPGVRADDPSGISACHGPASHLGGTSLYLWEAILTFVFVFVLYGAIMHPPTYGSVAPLAAGVTLWACLSTGKSGKHVPAFGCGRWCGAYTGLSPLNPAITLSSALVFGCFWRFTWMYWLAQLTGAGVAAGLAVFVFGKGPWLMDDSQRADYFAAAGRGGTAGYQPLLSGDPRAQAPAGAGMSAGMA